jgi:hypothetical protein
MAFIRKWRYIIIHCKYYTIYHIIEMRKPIITGKCVRQSLKHVILRWIVSSRETSADRINHWSKSEVKIISRCYKSYKITKDSVFKK